MVKVGFATFIAELAIGVMMVTGNYMFLSFLGEDGVAAFSVGCYLFPLIFSISNAVAQASQPIISYNYGAGLTGRVHQALNVALVAAIFCGLAISLVMWGGSGILAGIFLDSTEHAYEIAKAGLPMLGLCALPFALNITFIGYYQSCEHAIRSTIYMLLRGIILMIPGFIILPEIIGIPGLWLAIPVSELMTLIIIAASYRTRRAKPRTI